MLIIFGILISGALLGRLFMGRQLDFLPRLIMVIIWLLLLLLGVEVGGDRTLYSSLFSLGVTALLICAFALVGSIAASWFLWRMIRRNLNFEPTDNSDSGLIESDRHSSIWLSLRDSLIIIGFFVLGVVVGYYELIPFDITSIGVSRYALYALMFCVGVGLGHDSALIGQIRSLDRRLILLPIMTIVGTLLGAAVASIFLRESLADSLAVGSGFGYYSLSSIFIADLRSVELGSVALLCNVLREIFTLVAAPLVARLFGPLAAISIGGATTFDTTLPIITRAAGKRYAVVAIFHGCVVDFSVPFLVTLFCSL